MTVTRRDAVRAGHGGPRSSRRDQEGGQRCPRRPGRQDSPEHRRPALRAGRGPGTGDGELRTRDRPDPPISPEPKTGCSSSPSSSSRFWILSSATVVPCAQPVLVLHQRQSAPTRAPGTIPGSALIAGCRSTSGDAGPPVADLDRWDAEPREAAKAEAPGHTPALTVRAGGRTDHGHRRRRSNPAFRISRYAKGAADRGSRWPARSPAGRRPRGARPRPCGRRYGPGTCRDAACSRRRPGA